MTIQHLEEAKELRKQGDRLGRAGMSQYVIKAVDEFDGSYKGAMKLAGKLKAITLAARGDSYWDEMWRRGYTRALSEIERFELESIEDNKPTTNKGKVI